MATSRQGPGGCAITCLFLFVLLFPVIGSIFLTFMILADDLNCGEKILWLVLVWLVPVIGPLLYLVMGQRRNRVLAGYT
ncbi:MAG TPA: PLD nuclease N-terminal domain-containing protein [Ktedonobacterales bacterium]|nr:PLD nuclease N-terminal domain-containing protein [Ktedonobacterales bacterium]